MEKDQPIRYCLYARKSSESDERQAMSIDSQLKEMAELAQSLGLNIVQIKQESHSAKLSGKRPVFLEMLDEIRKGEYNGILTWAPDRLSRNAGDLGSLVDLMDSKQLAHIKTHSQEFSNNPNEKFLLMILCSQAKLENDNRAINVKRGIRAKCERGWRPCMPPLGYYTRAGTGVERDIIVDEERRPYLVQMFKLSAEGKGGRHIKQWLEDNGVKTRTGNMIHLSMIYKMLKNTFYYGEFEYPAGSGNWYKGNHEPLIDKKLFDRVQKQLEVPQKSKWGGKEFPFRRFLTCGACGSGVVGEEKFKKLKDGTTRRHVYYHCSFKKDLNCKEKYVKEADIVSGLTEMANELLLKTDDLEPGLKKDLEKQIKIMMLTNENMNLENAVPSYIKYIFENGSNFEKTRLVRNLDTKLTLQQKKLHRAPS